MTFITCQNCDRPIPLLDHIEERAGSDPVAREVVEMDRRATRELDAQADKQILIGHMKAVCAAAGQIFRELANVSDGVDGEVEFEDAGKPSGKKVYVQLKSNEAYLQRYEGAAAEIFHVNEVRHLDEWATQPVDVYLVIRDADQTIRWMNLTRYLRKRKDRTSRQIAFDGVKLDLNAMWQVREAFFPKRV
jgi:hypothetical protein